jgi:hypothetical protein
MALLTLVAVPLAGAADPAPVLPNLVADPPTGAYLQNYSYGNGTSDLLLRFDGYVHNAGPGALDVRATRTSTSDPLTPVQRVYKSDGTFDHDQAMPRGQLVYTDADGHHHWHLQEVARYTLWNAGKTQQVAPSMKVGFCLMDSDHIDAPTGPSTAVYTDANGRDFCQRNNPDALTLFEGVSRGWRDIYDSGLAYQWVVASDVQPGVYWLREDVDPGDAIAETDESSPPAYSATASTIPGYAARAVATPTTPAGATQQVTLDATSYGSPGARRFKVVTPPAHGTLDVATGSSFAGPGVTYTPEPGYSGPDSFTYAALDSTSPYPLHPGTATVSLSVGVPAPTVVIDGAPSTIETDRGVQLHATVAGDSPGVTWSATAGTIGSDGFYTAPHSVPAGGSVTIAARSASGASDQRVVTVTSPPPAQAAPSPPDVVSPPTPQKAADEPARPKPKSRLGPIVAGLAGRALVSRVTPLSAGKLALVASVGSRRLGGCRSRVASRQRFACRIDLGRGVDMSRLHIVARLTTPGGRFLARRTRVGPPLSIRPHGISARAVSRLSRRVAAFLLCDL